MTAARYLIRFDDLCPTMNWQVWDRVESLLIEHEARPLLAVIPDNKDPSQEIERARPDFWERVRSWQARGWAIGLHGYQHVYVSANRGLFGYDARSEFAGLSKAEQEGKVHRGLAILEREGIRSPVWVAPNHSFDATTLIVLEEAGLRVISDGNGLFPHTDGLGLTWIPRQLYRFERRPLGVWTVCLHHNRWTGEQVSDFGNLLTAYSGRITDAISLVSAYGGRRRGFIDECFAAQRALKRRIGVGISTAEKAIRGPRSASST
jgi:predicted deacetylase